MILPPDFCFHSSVPTYERLATIKFRLITNRNLNFFYHDPFSGGWHIREEVIHLSLPLAMHIAMCECELRHPEIHVYVCLHLFSHGVFIGSGYLNIRCQEQSESSFSLDVKLSKK
uniref:Uncharacterized protein n=1 Tax=Oryzias sinensis TaxID=183150 RepID=A0A8C7XA61_9TELE